jgi:coproporphyrinogen III oxidase-like Fe-S oxidoreductase
VNFFNIMYITLCRLTRLTYIVANNGRRAQVDIISHLQTQNAVVVAGTFTQAGNISCVNICIWDLYAQSWLPVADNSISGRVTGIVPYGVSLV